MTGPRATVLVVEDDPALPEKLAEVLKWDGFAVAYAADGAEAIERLAADRTSADPLCCLVLDLVMPCCDGFAVLGYLQARGHPLPVVVIGAYDYLLPRAAAAGAQVTLPKPFAVERLRQAAWRC